MKKLALVLIPVLIMTISCQPTSTATPAPTPVPPTPTAILPTATALLPTSTPILTATALLPTSTPILTATNTLAPETSVIFSENFDGPCKVTELAGWKAACDGGEYAIVNDTGIATTLLTIPYRDITENTTIAIDIRLGSGPEPIEYGFRLTALDAPNNNHLFRINFMDRTIAYVIDNKRVIVETGSSPIKPAKEKNRLKVVWQENQMAFYVNDQFLDTVTGVIFSKATLGFYIGYVGLGNRVAFDNLAISQINRPIRMPQPRPTGTPTSVPPTGILIITNDAGDPIVLKIYSVFDINRYGTYTIGQSESITLTWPANLYNYTVLQRGKTVAEGQVLIFVGDTSRLRIR